MVLTSHNFYEPSPPTPFRWLKDGTLYPIRPETRGNNTYWYLRKMYNGKALSVYLGGEGQLEPALLDNAVVQVEHQAKGDLDAITMKIREGKS